MGTALGLAAHLSALCAVSKGLKFYLPSVCQFRPVCLKPAAHPCSSSEQGDAGGTDILLTPKYIYPGGGITKGQHEGLWRVPEVLWVGGHGEKVVQRSNTSWEARVWFPVLAWAPPPPHHAPVS